jgi:hypothetical protein
MEIIMDNALLHNDLLDLVSTVSKLRDETAVLALAMAERVEKMDYFLAEVKKHLPPLESATTPKQGNVQRITY